jgi:hypothetical protein
MLRLFQTRPLPQKPPDDASIFRFILYRIMFALHRKPLLDIITTRRVQAVIGLALCCRFFASHLIFRLPMSDELTYLYTGVVQAVCALLLIAFQRFLRRGNNNYVPNIIFFFVLTFYFTKVKLKKKNSHIFIIGPQIKMIFLLVTRVCAYRCCVVFCVVGDLSSTEMSERLESCLFPRLSVSCGCISIPPCLISFFSLTGETVSRAGSGAVEYPLITQTHI